MGEYNVEASLFTVTCPLGYFKEGNNCSPCPIGTYGYMTDVGSACQSCPFSAGPGMTGLTDISQCEIKGEWYFPGRLYSIFCY